ncbi:MAG: hypothetical protein WBW33_29835 [Bryobacteraceae bacterium]
MFPRVVLTALLALRLFASSPRIEINYGPIPLDVYTMPNINANGDPYIANCPLPTPSNPTTVQTCIQTMSANYVANGATGVRFMFALRGGFGADALASYGLSTPWDSDGNVQPAWVDNLNLFLSDLKAAGFIYIAPTPALVGAWTGAPYATVLVSKCGDPTQTETLNFYRWMPFGFLPENNYPDCAEIPDGYNVAATPPVIGNQGFWGWQPFHNLISAVISSTITAGLLLTELDVSQEINVADFTVMARLIYDNTTRFDVLADIQSLLASNGLDPKLATYSVASTNPGQAVGDCLSGYGDSGMLAGASALQSAFAGQGFGYPTGFTQTLGLPCGGTKPVSPTLPAAYTIMPVLDVHTYPCIKVAGVCHPGDVTTTATLLYTGIASLAGHYENAGTVIIGETIPAGPTGACISNQYAAQNVAGYEASSLPSSGSAVVIRPWSWLTNPCYQNPIPLLPLYNSGSSISVTNTPTETQQMVSWLVAGSSSVEIHVGSPSGTLFAATIGSGTAATGNWVSDGMQFYLQDVTNGKPLTLANTIGTATAHIPQSASLIATPQRINPGDGSGLGVTTLSWSALSSNVAVHVGSADGPLFAAGGNTGTATTGKWVVDGMVFYLVDSNSSQTLQTVTVQVSAN